MSAVALDVEFLPAEVHRIIHEVICESKGILWANVLVGELVPKDESSWAKTSLVFDETSESLDNHTCIKCVSTIEVQDQMHCLYEYEDGEPAFYLCPKCETESPLVDEDKQDNE
jgi:hypothetical protein